MSDTAEKNGSAKGWEFITADELMKRDTSSHPEEDYRRGYYDGFYKGMEAMSDYLGVDIPDELWNFWLKGKLWEWKRTIDGFEFPPDAPKRIKR
jgi:hypothetical protein